jgi:2-keto-myo-inositol isomerase
MINMKPPASRRQFVSTTAFAAGGLLLSQNSQATTHEATHSAVSVNAHQQFEEARQMISYCLNTSTINGGEVPVRQQLKIAAEAGYDAIEVWLRDVDRYVQQGGSLSDLRKEIEDLGLRVDSAIAFGSWIVDDAQARAAGLEQCKRDLATLQAIGGLRIAAPPVGATTEPGLNLDAAAERYRTLLEIAKPFGVIPQLELWGFSKNLYSLAQVLYVAAAADHPDACLLLDVYHLYKGGSDFHNMGLVPGANMHCLHMNDYPATPPRDKIADADRVYPGDGVAPLTPILQSLALGGFRGTLSLELFNRQYWTQPPQQVANTGLAKMKASVAEALQA